MDLGDITPQRRRGRGDQPPVARRGRTVAFPAPVWPPRSSHLFWISSRFS